MRSRSARWSGRANSSPRCASSSSTSSRAASIAPRSPHLHVEPCRPARGLGPDDAPEDEALRERVAAEPVRPVHAGRALADRVEPFHLRGVGLRVDEDAAHRVVRGRRDLHRRRRDVEHREVDELAVHARQPLEDRLAVEVRHVEQDAAVRGSAALRDLRVVGESDAVARGQLEPLGVVALHEALARRVAQDPALAADGLGHERARGLLREDHPRGVELDELHVPQAGSRPRPRAAWRRRCSRRAGTTTGARCACARPRRGRRRRRRRAGASRRRRRTRRRRTPGRRARAGG